MAPPPHLSTRDRAALERFVTLLRSELGSEIVELRLFGSKARGSSTLESDIDVMVIVESDNPALTRRVVDLAFDVNLDHGVFISPVVFSREVRQHQLWPFTTLGREAEQDGFAL